MLNTLLVILVIAVFALAMFAALGWISMCGFLAGRAVRMVLRQGQSDGYATHIPTAQELADAAQSERIAQTIRHADKVARETRRALRAAPR